MFRKIISFFLLLTLLHADTLIYQDCVPCTTLTGCSECLVYSGGPFNNQNNTLIAKCVDGPFGCKARNFNRTVFKFSCGGCLIDGWCSYSVSGYFLGNNSYYAGCSNSSDPVWNYTKNYLDTLYNRLYGNIVHSWCESVCDKVTAGQQGLIIFGVTGGLAIIFALISHLGCSKRSDSTIL